MILITLMLLLQVKHFVIDFPLQTKYQWSNKGTYGHPGGLLHAMLHGIGTFLCIAFVILDIPSAIILSFADMIIHYHIDWAKMNINKKMTWGPTTHEQFWWLLGLDQLLHQVTYIGMICYLVTL
tara:strand:- start:32 stop:403 length:372 start_codon:yes stop_codon:yes gene_type:complete